MSTLSIRMQSVKSSLRAVNWLTTSPNNVSHAHHHTLLIQSLNLVDKTSITASLETSSIKTNVWFVGRGTIQMEDIV